MVSRLPPTLALAAFLLAACGMPPTPVPSADGCRIVEERPARIFAVQGPTSAQGGATLWFDVWVYLDRTPMEAEEAADVFSFRAEVNEAGKTIRFSGRTFVTRPLAKSPSALCSFEPTLGRAVESFRVSTQVDGGTYDLLVDGYPGPLLPGLPSHAPRPARPTPLYVQPTPTPRLTPTPSPTPTLRPRSTPSPTPTPSVAPDDIFMAG